jgi:signal transduction histidine kinase
MLLSIFGKTQGLEKLLLMPLTEDILTNFIANAWQAMPNGGNVTINACCKSDRALLSVKDT